MSGALTYSPAAILQQLLVDLALGTDPGDDDSWPIYNTREPDTPDALISVHNTVGITQGRLQPTGEVVEFHGVMVRVRATTAEAAYAKARAIAVALDEEVELDVTTVTDTNGENGQAYTIYSISRSSGPISLGKEPTSKRNVLSINVTVAITQN